MNDRIRRAQAALAVLGYKPGPVDGERGPLTDAALIVFALDALGDMPAGDELAAELERDEGCVLHAYVDNLGYLTIGIGRLIDQRKGGGITREEALHLFANDVAKVNRALDGKFPWWVFLDPVRQRALQNMTFQLGIGGLATFTATMPLIRDGKYDQAAANLEKSKWARQTPERAKRVIAMIRTGRA